jgi:RNA polymerase sigma factor (sigma-70 family)
VPAFQDIPNDLKLRIPVEVLRSGELGLDDGCFDHALSVRLAERVRRVVRSELYRSRLARAEDVEDVCSDCMVALLGRMEDFKTNPEAVREIEDLDAYVAVLAQRACSAWSRRQYPGFHRLRTAVRYVLTPDGRFALWQNAGDEWVCGQVKWQGSANEVRSANPETCNDVAGTGAPAQVLDRIFNYTGHPLYFNELVKICAQLWVVDDRPQSIESLEEVARPDGDMETALYREARLKRVWDEIRELPPRQRMALLLNMHGPDGECGTSLLILTGTVSPREVAGVIGIPAAEFAELLTRLPLTDLEIAERMQITRQQVINLRKCARERLRRRMGWD